MHVVGVGLEIILQLHGGRMRGETEVVVVAVELCGVSLSARVLIHTLELEVAVFEEIVYANCRHIQETVFACAVAVHEIVACCELHLWRDEIAALQITAQIIIVFRDFLTFGESHVHPVGFSCKIPAMEEHSKFKSHAGIVGALVLAFHVH